MSRYISQLDCFHTAMLDPSPIEGDTVYCRLCGDYRTVTNASAEWRIKCATCSMGRAFGADETGARALAGKHADERNHDVKIVLAGHQVALIRPARAPLGPVAAWLAEHPEHQGQLRGKRSKVTDGD